MAKRGRPIKPDAKREAIHFRLNNKQMHMLESLSEWQDKSKTDIFIGLLINEFNKTDKERGDDVSNNVSTTLPR